MLACLVGLVIASNASSAQKADIDQWATSLSKNRAKMALALTERDKHDYLNGGTSFGTSLVIFPIGGWKTMYVFLQLEVWPPTNKPRGPELMRFTWKNNKLFEEPKVALTNLYRGQPGKDWTKNWSFHDWMKYFLQAEPKKDLASFGKAYGFTTYSRNVFSDDMMINVYCRDGRKLYEWVDAQRSFDIKTFGLPCILEAKNFASNFMEKKS